MKGYSIRLLFVLTAIVLSFAPLAKADIAHGQPRFTWIPPTQDGNNQILPAGAILDYSLYCDGAAAAKAVIPGIKSAYTAALGDFPPGPHTCFLVARTAQGNSLASNNAPWDQPIVFVVPKAPTNLTVN